MRSWLGSSIVAVAVVGGAADAARADDEVRPPGLPAPLGTERLSDERRTTRWAHSVRAATVRTRPRGTAAGVGRLRIETEDARPEVVLVLAAQRTPRGTWLHVRFAPGAFGRRASGWIPRSALGALRVARGRLVVDRRTLHARFEDGRGVVRWSARVGVGAPATPTPGGRFFVRERLRGDGDLYGSWAIGTSAYASVSDWPGGQVVGVHGTNAPARIPGRPSHGCVRLRDADVRRLVRLVGSGTPVWIR